MIHTQTCSQCSGFKLVNGWDNIYLYILDPVANKVKKRVFQVTGLKIIGWVGTHIFLLEKNIILCILKGILCFKMHKIIYFFQKT